MVKNDTVNFLINARHTIQDIINGTQQNNIDVDLFLVRKRTTGHYYFSQIPITNMLQLSILTDLIEANIGMITSSNFNPYNAFGSEANTLEFMDSISVPAIETLNEDLSEQQNVSVLTDEGNVKFSISKTDFYLINVRGLNKEISFLRRYTNSKNIKKFIPLAMFDTTYSRLDQNLLLLDPLVDLIIIDDELLVLNRYALEVVLSYKDRFFDILNCSLDIIEQQDIIENFSQFRNDCACDLRIARIFTQVHKNNNLNIVSTNLDKVENAIRQLQLPISFVNNKLIYSSNDDLQAIITILSDGFAKTLIGERAVKAVL